MIAPFYDALARMVFGESLDRAQQVFLTEIKAGSKVLIIGGGTGKILEWLPEGLGLQIHYIELSQGMLQKARLRVSKGNTIQFSCQDVRKTEGNYDVIIANFFLDCFCAEDLQDVLLHLKGLLIREGKLLVTDFYPTDAWQEKLLIKLMHQFFGVVAKLEAKALTNIHDQIKAVNFQTINVRFFRNGTIFSTVYRPLADDHFQRN